MDNVLCLFSECAHKSKGHSIILQPVKGTLAEFFAGGGLVRAAMASDWRVAFANDIDPKKCRTYRQNWGDAELVEGDVGLLDPSHLNQPIDLFWASSPCQDFSLAGHRKGLSGHRSGTFLPWIKLVGLAIASGFAPKIIAFENVTGLISSQQGNDFKAVLTAFSDLGYRFGALEIDAKLFVPQSRPRLFVIAVRADINLDESFLGYNPTSSFHSKGLARFVDGMPATLRQNWLWLNLPEPEPRSVTLASCIEPDFRGPWFSDDKTDQLLSLMSPLNREKVKAAQRLRQPVIGTIYKRGRPDAAGATRQRAEVRFDGIAGCLRTPAGGSSRQTLVFVDGNDIRMRLLSAREASLLMGIPKSYLLPASYNEAYKISGDGVVVPVVAHLKQHLFDRIVVLETKKMAA